MTHCIKSPRKNGSPFGKARQSGHPADATYCILEHGMQDHLLTDIPLQTGYYPLRWRVAIGVLLVKNLESRW
jgi:hypothetical protein